jgi:hypothetical protein
MYKFIKNFTDTEPKSVIRLSDKLQIVLNTDSFEYQEYLKWVAEGNTPESADEGNTPA